ncbi:SusC/RagA family TonB-linked outer membrane protein [Polluticaenibacter yanchengensis]|uniref:SusC/RagA family TonB-linked outer membrane protein n=1 Tax=Polluticaenibacter yanchengensis TaxID=3014562 RepID=A0ABT4UMK7_9BACT|nr:SusC/RagA family TonB-linked outer membrane protein [Chitinophagaceae bacterium LY-5]
MLLGIIASAQNIKFSGKVTDSKSAPLDGVSVVVKGSNTGTTTNEAGFFEISVPVGKELEFSILGYATKRYKITGKESNFSIVLETEEKSTVDDVVITGYQNKKRSTYAGASSTVKAGDIKVASLGTLDKMLQGQVAGVAIENTSSTFGTAPKIRVRGSASLSGINEPLWVLDGVPLEAPLNIVPSELYGGNARNLLASALSNVNPEDIEDITVLKDATATAMYGTRSVNGVIVVNTKRAKKNTPLRVNYTMNATLNLKPSILDFDVLNSKDQTILNEQLTEIYQATLMNFTANTTGAYTKLLDQYNRREITELQFREKVRDIKLVNTDWFDVLYKNSIQHQHSVSMSYGGERNATRLSFSYYDDPGKMLGENTKRYTANMVNTLQVTDNFSAEIMLKYARRDQRNSGTQVNPFTYARDASRAMRPYDDEGKLEYYRKGFAPFNIINEINNNYINLSNNDFLAQLNLNYQITKNLKFTTLMNTRYSESNINEIQTEYSNYAAQFRVDDFRLRQNSEKLYKSPGAPSYELPQIVLPEGGILDKETASSKFYTLRGQFEWSIINNDNHKLDLFMGSEITQNKQSTNFARNYGYRSESKTFASAPLAYERLLLSTSLPEDERRMYNGRNLLQGTSTYITEFTRNAVSYYGSMSYSFKQKYNFDASLRNDATNVSGRSSRNRFLPTWALGASWSISKERFMESVDHVLSDVKARVSYGLRGNAGYRGPDLIAYYENIIRLYPGYNTTGVNIVESENTALEFEKEYMFSTGIDFTLFKSLDFTLNYYSRKNFDLVGYRPVQTSAGYLTKLFNWADMKNEGYEASVNIRPIKITRDFRWSGMFNVGYNKNTVLSDYQGNNPSVYNVSVGSGFPMLGRPMTGLYSFQFAGLNHRGLSTYYTSKGDVVDGFIESDRNLLNVVYQGSRDPLYSGGFASNFMYKNLTVGVSFVFNAGHVVRKADFYRGNTISGLYRDDQNINGDYAYRWLATGNEAYTQIPRLILQDDINDYNNAGFFNASIFAAYNMSDIRTVKASYLRIRNVTANYNFGKLAQKFKMQNLVLGMEVSNLAVFASKKLKGMDPETLLTGLNTPPVRSVTLNLSATF